MEKRDVLTLGSLFDGSGGFPLGGLLSGILPVWASEIEPFPIRVTTKRLPFMKHYGDISTIDGGEVEPVDIISSTFSGLIATLAAFDKSGYKMAGITEVNANYTDWNTNERARVPAIRLVRS